jgi:hypothetical protein
VSLLCPYEICVAAWAGGDAVFFVAALVAVFLTAAFFAVAAGFSFCFAACTAAHLFFVACEMAFLPASDRLRFGFAGSCVVGAGGADSPRILAHRRC